MACLVFQAGMRKTFGPVFIILLLFGGAGSAMAGSSSAEMQVSATVIARTLIGIDSQPSEVVVTAGDVARGYVELPAALAFHVRSNNPAGFLLQFGTASEAFAGAEVRWDSSVVRIEGSEAWIAQPYRRGVTPVLATVRLDLAAGTGPGRYAWPLSVAANNL